VSFVSPVRPEKSWRRTELGFLRKKVAETAGEVGELDPPVGVAAASLSQPALSLTARLLS